MRRKLLVSLGLAALLLLVLPGQVSHATPTAPYILVNDSTKQCTITILGDECSWCDPPQGWRVLDTSDPAYRTMSCPAGYTKLDRIEMSCRRYRTPYCCGGFSTQGDCKDMVINATEQACAFVNDVNACILPEGWTKRPTQIPEWNWRCNFNTQHWVDNLTCLTATQTPEPVSVVHVAREYPGALPAAGLGLIALGGGLLAWMIKKH